MFSNITPILCRTLRIVRPPLSTMISSRPLHNAAITQAVTPSGQLVTPVQSDHILEQTHTNAPNTRTLILNRPKALHALSTNMLLAIYHRILHYDTDPNVTCIILHSRPLGRAFCAGGDVRALHDVGITGDLSIAENLFRIEYRNNALLARSRRAVITPIMDGIVMGGGVGLCQHAPIRIVTENTVYAMPECAIGLHPDIGASYFLSRLPRARGIYLALTGARVRGPALVDMGLGTHLISASNIPHLLARLHSTSLPNTKLAHDIISEFTQSVPSGSSFRPEEDDVIERCFSRDSVEGIFAALHQEIQREDCGQSGKFAQNALDMMVGSSPTSLKITLESMRRGAKLSLDECLKMEFRLTMRCVHRPDFYAGVSAALVKKDHKASWNPAVIEAVSASDVQQFFEPLGVDLQVPELNTEHDTVENKSKQSVQSRL